MTRFTHAVEHRFVVPGRAVSFRSARAAWYKKHVRAIALAVFPKTPPRQEVEVFLDYFHALRRRVDVDNITKCVLDALNGIAYVDDQQVLHQYSRAYNLAEPLFVIGGPVDLVKPLAKHDEYLFVRVRAVSGRRRHARKRGSGA
jgi:Holliday junction resolvase RusA-like endonuclease